MFKKVEQYKYLELIITDKLTWGENIGNIHGKIARILGSIGRYPHKVNETTKYLKNNSFI